MPEGRRQKKYSQHGQAGWKRRQSHSALEEIPESSQAGPVPVGAVLSTLEYAHGKASGAPKGKPKGVAAKPVPAPVEESKPAVPAEAPVPETEPASAAVEPTTVWGKARRRVARTRAAVEHAQLKAKDLVHDPQLHYSVVGAGAGAVIGGTGGAASGLTTGTLLGAAVGVIPAVFTFGLSIPFCAAVGGGTGLAVGAATGFTCGGLAGGATGFQAYHHRDEIRETASKTLEQVTSRAEIVKARANAATSFLSERATVARARIMGGGTGGTEEAHD